MQVRYYDPDLRAREKAASRARDEADLQSGKLSREELQRINGGYGIFRNSRLVIRPQVNRKGPDASTAGSPAGNSPSGPGDKFA